MIRGAEPIYLLLEKGPWRVGIPNAFAGFNCRQKMSTILLKDKKNAPISLYKTMLASHLKVFWCGPEDFVPLVQ